MATRYKSYDGPGMRSFPVGSGSLAALAVLAMFALLPFTQFLAGLKKPNLEVRQFEVTVPPPQFTPPEPPPPEPPAERDPPPEMEPPPPQLSLSQLSMSLNPGVGDALASGFALGEVGVSAEETMDQISLFEISDLDGPVSVQRKPFLQFSPRMRREKDEGLIHMVGIINPDGTVEISEVLETIDSDYAALFKKYFEGFIYSKPTVAGNPVSARIIFKIPVKWQ